MNKKVEIVSLGVNCLPRTVLTRNGIKPKKAEGELSCPFDLVWHQLPNIIHYLKTDFNDYLDDIHFIIRKRNFLDFRKKGKWHKTDGTVFNHDLDCQFYDKEKLLTRIKNRIDNFHNIISSEVPILFVLNILDDADRIPDLYFTLKKICSHKKFKLMIIDFYDKCNEGNTNSDISVLKLPLPFEDWLAGWNGKKWIKSDFGKYVEKCIAQYTTRLIDKEFK